MERKINNTTTQINHNIPTPEEFMKIFCSANLKVMKFTHQLLNKMPKHGQIFNMLEDDYMGVGSFDGDKREKIGIIIEKDNTVNIANRKSEIVELSIILSNSIKMETYDSITDELPLKRKGMTEILEEPLIKRVKFIETNKIPILNYPNFLSEGGINEINQSMKSFDAIKISAKFIQQEVLHRSVKHQFCIGKQMIIKSNLNNIPANQLDIPNTKTGNQIQPDISINFQFSKSKPNKTYRFDNKKVIWETRYLIRKLLSFHGQITNNFIDVSQEFKNLLMNYSTYLLSDILFLKNKITKHIFIMSHDNFFKFRHDLLNNDTVLSLLKSFGESLVQLVNRNFKMAKFNIVRLICFILYCLNNKISFPIDTISIVKWSEILDVFCIFDANFLKLYRNIELVDLKYCNTRKLNKLLIISPIQLRKLMIQLVQSNHFYYPNFNKSIYECFCGKIFISQNEWYTHINDSDHRANIEIGNSRKAVYCQNNDIFCVTQRVILSKYTSGNESVKKKYQMICDNIL